MIDLSSISIGTAIIPTDDTSPTTTNEDRDPNDTNGTKIIVIIKKIHIKTISSCIIQNPSDIDLTSTL